MSRGSRNIKSLIEGSTSLKPSASFLDSTPNQGEEEEEEKDEEPSPHIGATPTPQNLLKRVNKMTMLAENDKFVIEKLQDRAHHSKSEVEKRANLLTQLQVQFKSLTAMHAADRRRLEQALQHVEEKEQEIVTLKSRDSKIVEDTSEQYKALLTQKTDEILRLTLRVEEIESERNSYKRDHASSSDRLTMLEGELLSARKAATTSEAKIEELKIEVKNLNNQLEALHVREQLDLSEASKARQECEGMKRTIENLMSRIEKQTLEGNLKTDAAQAKILDLLTEKDKDKEQLRRLESMLLEAGTVRGVESLSMQEMMKEKEDMLIKSRRLEAELTNERLHLLKVIDGLKSRVDAFAEGEKGTMSEKESLTKLVSGMKMQQDTLEGENKELRMKGMHTQEEMNSLKVLLGENEEELERVKDENSILQVKVKALLSTQNDADAKLETFTAQAKELLGYQDKVEELERKVSAMVHQLDKVEEREKIANMLCRESQHREGELISKIGDCESVSRADKIEIRRLEELLEAHAVRITSLNSQMEEERRSTTLRVELLTKREATFEKREMELKAGVTKLLNIEKNIEAELTCLHCMNIFEKPVTVSACGHNYCEKCVAGYQPTCSECFEKGNADTAADMIITVCSDDRLTTLTGKFAYIKQTLASMKRELDVTV